MTRLRLGVLGAGSWVNASHLPVLAERGDIQFAGVNRRNPADLERMRERWGFELGSSDYRDVLAMRPDIVIVASPTALHHEHAKAALEAGAHVLVEKPFTITAADAWDLAETADRVQRHLVIAMGYNFKPLVTRAAQLLEDHGGLGEIESLLVSMSSGVRSLLGQTGAYPKASGDFPPEAETWVDPKLSGGGYAQAQLPHALGAALYLTGQRAKRVYAEMGPDRTAVELNDALAVRYTDGAIGTVSGTSAHPGFLEERDQLNIRIVGSDGQLDLEFEKDRVAFHREGDAEVVQLDAGDGSYDCVGPPNALADLALGLPVPNRAPAELGARVTELLAAAYRSAESGRAEAVADSR